jgi:transposase
MPRRKFTSDFKARVVLGMLIDNKTLSQAGLEHGIQGSVLSRWRKEFLERAPQLFEQPDNHSQSEQRITELERLAGLLAQQPKKFSVRARRPFVPCPAPFPPPQTFSAALREPPSPCPAPFPPYQGGPGGIPPSSSSSLKAQAACRQANT